MPGVREAPGELWGAGAMEQLEVPVAMQSPGSSNPKYQAINQEDSQGGPFDFLGRFIHKDEIFWQEPAGTFTINNGAAYTGSRTVTLNSTVSDALSIILDLPPATTVRAVRVAPVRIGQNHSRTGLE